MLPAKNENQKQCILLVVDDPQEKWCRGAHGSNITWLIHFFFYNLLNFLKCNEFRNTYAGMNFTDICVVNHLRSIGSSGKPDRFETNRKIQENHHIGNVSAGL